VEGGLVAESFFHSLGKSLVELGVDDVEICLQMAVLVNSLSTRQNTLILIFGNASHPSDTCRCKNQQMTFTFPSSTSTLPPLYVLDVQDDNKDAKVKRWMLGLQVGTRTWGPAQSYFGCVPTVLEVRIRLVKS
jgi:hypothetical protein